ncbi:MAG: hypothetical protein P4L79_08745 [Legionella sp.]|uniref:hypothetical protein n=1 Tax=Legionella sp. TaxID=459 RepID=UPI00283B2C11|nr:hypothetical protein [Legionella sp.]
MNGKIELNPPQKNQKKRKQIEPIFKEDYVYDLNWHEIKDHIFAALKYRYPEYFTDDKPNYIKIGEELKNNPLKAKAAREIFISYFKFPYQSTHRTANTEYPYMMDIINECGNQIIAHGVEEAKGGMYNLLMMAVSNQVCVPQVYWGALIPGQPNISPVSHGPFYVIYETPFYEQESYPHNPKFTEIACILVPFELNKTLLSEAMEKMVSLELTTESVKQLFISKLRSYAEFYDELLEQKKESTKTLANSFVAPLSWMSAANNASSEEIELPEGITVSESDEDEDPFDWLLMP